MNEEYRERRMEEFNVKNLNAFSYRVAVLFVVNTEHAKENDIHSHIMPHTFASLCASATPFMGCGFP
jgi:hypothetical protein